MLTRYFRRKRWDRERALELADYVETETQENIARGMTPDDARAAARRKLGNPTLVREEIYRMNTLALVDSLWQDLRHGARMLRLNPGFTLVAVASLALGIGANTAIFQLVDAVRLRSLPVRDPQELVEIYIPDMNGARGSFNRFPALTNPQWEQIRARQSRFASVFAWSAENLNISPGGEDRYIKGLWVSGEAFDALGLRPAAGRLLHAADDQRGCGLPGAVLSYAFWQREFGGKANAVGSKLIVNEHPVEIIGVTPESFFGLETGRSFDIAVPLCSDPVLRGASARLDRGTAWWLTVIGRLKPGATVAQASAYVNSISPGIFEATLPSNYPPVNVKNYLGFKLTATPGGTGISMLRRDYSTSLYVLLGITGLVLAIACANLANLMLARASARQREMAVRLAMGASRGRVVRQVLSESLLLALLGAAAGLWLAGSLSRFLVSFLNPDGNSVFVDLTPDWRVLGFTGALTILTCVLFGLAPALRATSTPPGEVLKSGGRASTAARGSFLLQRMLVAAQVAISLVLVVGALLFVRSLRNLATLDAGFRQDGILIAGVQFGTMNLPPERVPAFRRELLEKLRAIPGVDSAADTDMVPISGSSTGNAVWMDGEDAKRGKDSLMAAVGPDYFKTMGTQLLAGRDFDEHDVVGAPQVAIVNQTFAEQLSPGVNPVGRRFRIEATPNDPEQVYEIVGIVRNSKYQDLREQDGPVAFLAIAQDPHGFPVDTFVLHSAGSVEPLIGAVRQSLREIHPGLRYSFQVFKTQIEESLLPERLVATLSGFFGVLAGVLAAIGLYGVISYTVARRTNEIGIRMALGAARSDVLAMILREVAGFTAAGLAVGVVLAIGGGKLVDALLFGLRPYDPATLAVAVAALTAVALAASYWPARRAAKLDPMVALREE